MKRCHSASWRPGGRAGRRAFLRVATALVAAALALPLLAAAPGPAALGGHRHLQVLASQPGRDLLTSATSSQRLVPLNTVKYDNGTPGVQVGGSFYPDPDSEPLQLLVLDRSDLRLDFNFGLGVNPPPDYFGSLGGLLQQLPNTDLVIITHPGSTAAFPSDSLPSLNNALGKVGGTLPALWTFPAGSCWSGAANACSNPPNSDKWVSWQRGAFNGDSFTVIGVPGLAVGQAWRETAYQTNSRDGRIVGYLTRGTATTGGTDYYTVINGGPDHYVPVDTCAPPHCAVRIGNKSYLPPSPNGLHVVELDRTTLGVLANRTVTNTSELLSVITHSGVRFGSVGHFFSPPSVDDQRLIIIQSVGDSYFSSKATTPLVQYLDELGGTPDLLLGILSGHRYALVGAATNLPWRNPSALESSAQVPVIPGSRDKQTGQISGVLERDRDGLYTPLAGDPISATNTDLYRIIYQPAQPWPYAADTQALRYIADNIGLCQPQNPTCKNADVRSAYTNRNLANSWGHKRNELDSLGCTNPSACGPHFKAVKKQLLMEFPWVTPVYDFGRNLLMPYAAGDLSFNVQKVVDKVQESVKVPDSTTVTMQWLSIMSNVMSLASSVAAGLSGSAVYGLIASAGTLATSVMEQPNSDGGPADAVTATAKKLGEKMALQQAAYTQWVDQMEGILLTDYGKLSAVGNAITKGNPQWDWEAGVTTSKAVTALRADATASAYSALLPKVWPVYNLKPDGTTQAFSNNVKTLRCNPGPNASTPNYPFASALDENQFRPPHGALTTIAGDGGWVGQAWVFAKLDPARWNNTNRYARTAELPTTSLTGNIYGRQSTGQYGAYQYEPVWWRNTYNPPAYTICTAATTGSAVSSAYPPPHITPPPP